MAITLNGTTGITNDGGYTGDGVVFADTTPASTLVTTTGGNLGIGTSSPAAKLDVSGSVNYTGTLTGGTGVVNLGSGQVFKDASGNVGIGTSLPTYKLDVQSTTNALARIKTNTTGFALLDIDSAASNQAITIFKAGGVEQARIFSPANEAANILAFARGTGATESMRIDSSGNLGIGTASPANKLQIAGVSGVSAALDMNQGIATGNEFSALKFTASIPGYVGSEIRGINTNGGTNLGVMAFHTSATEKMRLDSSGNLGIGTTSPVYKFDLRGGVIAGGTGTIVGGISYSTRPEIGSISNHACGFITNNTTQMLLDTSGNLGIGTTTPRAQLDIATGVGTATTIGLHIGYSPADFYGYRVVNENNPSQTAAGNFKIQRGTTAAWVDSLVVDNSGNLLLGTTSVIGGDGPLLSISRNACIATMTATTGLTAAIGFHNPNGRIGYIGVSGTTTSYVTSSDYRLKEAIAPMTGALSKIAQLKPCTYTWKVDDSVGQGFIAHELAAVVPGCVTGEKDAVDAEGKPQYQGIDTSFLVATLTAAIQEQQVIIESLTARITALETAP